jgi:hypothetical protein
LHPECCEWQRTNRTRVRGNLPCSRRTLNLSYAKTPSRNLRVPGGEDVAPLGLEPRFRVPETLVLSLELWSQKKAALDRLICGEYRSRTDDLLHAMQAL